MAKEKYIFNDYRYDTLKEAQDAMVNYYLKNEQEYENYEEGDYEGTFEQYLREKAEDWGLENEDILEVDEAEETEWIGEMIDHQLNCYIFMFAKHLGYDQLGMPLSILEDGYDITRDEAIAYLTENYEDWYIEDEKIKFNR